MDATLDRRAMDFIEEVLVVHNPNNETDCSNQIGKFLTEVVKLLLQKKKRILL
jgi:hypothetical protein